MLWSIRTVCTCSWSLLECETLCRFAQPHPFAIEEKENLVVHNRPAQTASKMIYGRSGLVIPRRRISKVVRRIQQRTIPQFIEISVQLIRARLGDVVDLGCSIPPFIHGTGKSVDGHF